MHDNGMTHLVAALVAYTIQPLKLSLIKLIASFVPEKTYNWG